MGVRRGQQFRTPRLKPAVARVALAVNVNQHAAPSGGSPAVDRIRRQPTSPRLAGDAVCDRLRTSGKRIGRLGYGVSSTPQFRFRVLMKKKRRAERCCATVLASSFLSVNRCSSTPYLGSSSQVIFAYGRQTVKVNRLILLGATTLGATRFRARV
jgi:hypothetical protein